jgi:F-box and WD-40 domain protein 1/11
MTRRVFPIEEWTPSQESQASSNLSYTPSNSTQEGKEIPLPPISRFRKRLRSLPLGNDSDFTDGLRNLSLNVNVDAGASEKREGGLRGLFRRASVSLKSKHERRYSQAVLEHARPQTSSSPWLHKLRGAASFNRHSKFQPPHLSTEEPVDSCEELFAPIPGTGTEPPIIPRGNGGARARATAAAQNEYFGRHRQLLYAEDQLGDRESGIGIALTTTEPMLPYDNSISRVDFISLLPAELSIQILAHLDHQALLKTSMVSKSWGKFSQSNHIWREAFLREKSKTYAMSQPVKPGAGLGLPNCTPDTNWKELYRIRQQLEHNWREGKAEPTYLSGHLDSIYCVQFDE